VSTNQRQAWEAVAEHWARIVRDGSHDANLAAFYDLLPPPGRLALDIACGEGRVARELAPRGYRTVGIDSSPTLVRLAREADPSGDYRVADAAALPFAGGAFDLVVVFMSLQDVDDAVAVLREAGRVLERGGRLCLAVLHPLWTAGEIDAQGDRLVIRGSYLDTVPHVRPQLRLPSIHRPLEAYFRGLEEGGLHVETLRELPLPERLGGRLPVYLHARAARR
jgi:ubiquinone/menaquinone biosynthesis C-methylase UbiE